LAALLEVPNWMTGDSPVNPHSNAKLLRPFALVTPSTMPYNSASALLNAYAPCVALQVFIACPPIIHTPPDVDFLSFFDPPQSLSVKTCDSADSSCHRNCHTTASLPTKYLATFFNIRHDPFLGVAMSRLQTFTPN
jgi:hypothetical protein